MKKIILIVILLAVAGGVYLIVKNPINTNVETEVVPESPVATTTETVVEDAPEFSLGKSVEGREIKAFRFSGSATSSPSEEKEVLFVGGIHGGYSWNTALVAYELIDYLKENPDAVPEGVKVTVVPVLNPDGLAKVVEKEGPFEASDVSTDKEDQVAGRFNGNNVDLNRNFDCDWKASGVWQNKTVSGGTKAFSEPESQAIRKYIQDNDPTAVVVWYASAGGVYASNCHNEDGVSEETTELMGIFSKASGYPSHKEFDFYEITGDMTNWLAKIDIPVISILLTNHTSTDWSKNKAGIDAVLKFYSK